MFYRPVRCARLHRVVYCRVFFRCVCSVSNEFRALFKNTCAVEKTRIFETVVKTLIAGHGLGHVAGGQRRRDRRPRLPGVWLAQGHRRSRGPGETPRLTPAPAPALSAGSPAAVIDRGQAVEFWGDEDAGDGLKLPVNPLAGLSAFTAEIVFMSYSGGPHEQRFFHMEDEESSGNRVLLETRNGGFSPPDEADWAEHQATVPDGEWFLDACLQSASATEGERNLAIQFATHCTHPAESWHTASVVVDGDQFTHYVDGVAEISPKVPHAPHELPSEWLPLGNGSMSLGMRINNVSWFRGAIRAIRFTPRALTPGELLPPTPDWVPPPTEPPTVGPSATIRELLRDNVACWNSGDLIGFMAGYWEDEDLVFTSRGDVCEGYTATAANYRTNYGTGDGGVDTVSPSEDANLTPTTAFSFSGGCFSERRRCGPHRYGRRAWGRLQWRRQS